MGINMPENKSEGAAFGAAMEFDVETKDTDGKLKQPVKSEGAWDKYVNESINPDITQIMKNKNMERPSKTEYYLKIAETVSTRGTCLRRRFGAIIVKDDTIISTGYVGASRGRKNCCDIGKCFRMENNIPSGQRYELCRSVHAEMNAVMNADPIKRQGATLYLVGLENDGSYTEADCCSMCKRVIINSGISKVVFRTKTGGVRAVNVSDWVDNDDSLTLHEGY